MCFAGTKKKGAQAGSFFVSDDCHPQTIAVVKTRAAALGVNLIVGKPDTFDFKANEVRPASPPLPVSARACSPFCWSSVCRVCRVCRVCCVGVVWVAREQVVGAIVQYPTTDGRVVDYGDFVKRAHEHGVAVACGTDLLALSLLKPPGRTTPPPHPHFIRFLSIEESPHQ